ncbi:MAG: hypothetical protein Q7S03_02745 [bacterium]|nr:hypothetical protein [bacterium]
MNTSRSIGGLLILILILIGAIFLFSRILTSPESIGLQFPSQGTLGARTIEVDMSAVDPSTFDQSGAATLSEENGKVKVVINVNTPDLLTNQPAHIHIGSCPGVGAVLYPLNNVVNGRSETTIDTTLDQLENQQPIAINVHQSNQQIGIYTSCGQINI